MIINGKKIDLSEVEWDGDFIKLPPKHLHFVKNEVEIAFDNEYVTNSKGLHSCTIILYQITMQN